jgi:uncharacterized damage-inducible protein DinB
VHRAHSWAAAHITSKTLSYERFTQHVDYSYGSVRDQIVHLVNADEIWFSELQGVQRSEHFPPANFDDRNMCVATRQRCLVPPTYTQKTLCERGILVV